MLAGMVAKPRAYLGTVLQDDAHSLTIISGSGEWARLAGVLVYGIAGSICSSMTKPKPITN